MRTATLLAFAFITLGIAVVCYQTITNTGEKNIVEKDSLPLTTETTRTIPMLSIVGGVALVGGLLLLARKRPASRCE